MNEEIGSSDCSKCGATLFNRNMFMINTDLFCPACVLGRIQIYSDVLKGIDNERIIPRKKKGWDFVYDDLYEGYKAWQGDNKRLYLTTKKAVVEAFKKNDVKIQSRDVEIDTHIKVHTKEHIAMVQMYGIMKEFGCNFHSTEPSDRPGHVMHNIAQQMEIVMH